MPGLLDSPYGTSGTNLQELWARYMQNNSDPTILAQLSRYYNPTQNTQNSESGKVEYDFTPTNSRVGNAGTVMIGGVPYAQVGGPDRRRGGYGSVVNDDSVIYDPEFGYLSPLSNLNQTDNATRNWATLISSAIGGAAFSGGALGGEYFGYGTPAEGVPGYEPFEANYPGNQPWTPPGEGVPGGYEPFEANYPGNQPWTPPGEGPGVERIVVNGTRLPVEPFGPEAFAPLAPIVPPALNQMNDFTPRDEPQQRGLLDQLADNPLQTLGRAYSLFQLGNGLLNRGNNNSGNPGDGNNGDGSKGGNGTVTPYQRTPYQPNPFTQSQIQNFRYTGR